MYVTKMAKLVSPSCYGALFLCFYIKRKIFYDCVFHRMANRQIGAIHMIRKASL